jgi:hypothetical protein
MDIHSFIVSLHQNEVSIITTVIGGLITLIAAFVAVRAAFRQIARQFEHKVIYEGWQDLQKNLFKFSSALVNYSSNVQWLNYFIDSRNNPLVNKGDKSKHTMEKWHELIKLYNKLQRSYINFLRSFENNQVIFLPLSKMMKSFQSEYRKRVDDYNQKFLDLIFPEIYGQKNFKTDEELKLAINEYGDKMSEISAFLDDFRVELQNETVGKVLNKKVPKRNPLDKKYKILTRKGFIKAKKGLKDLLKIK